MIALRFPILLGILGASSAVSGCAASRLGGPVGEVAADPAALETEIASTTTPASPLQVNFGWTLNEGGSRVNGRGVVRFEAPERARLDLFGPRGETYLMAALVDEEYRLPPGAADTAVLPSPSLLWSAVGVLRPPADARLESATTTDMSADLRYRTPNGEIFAYTFTRDPAADSFALTRLERAAGRGVIESVNVDRDGDGTISRTRYRNWSEY
ncbi:MAG: hypothetical protein GEU90_02555, partial [Gemmatimonas sp.]|nr:hypothetical protein [Gemmatimonas sp.]